MYMTWKVIEKYSVRFYVVNRDTKQVQSTWANYLDAKNTCDKLNKLAA